MRVCHRRIVPGVIAVALLAVPTLTRPARADDNLSIKTLEEIKSATAFIVSRPEGGGMGGVGSGFAITVDGDSVYVATNYHVIRPHNQNHAANGAAVIQMPVVTVTFRSSTRNEQTVRATIVAADETRDLAILRVSGVHNPPKAIDFQNTPPLVETTTVYIFGFPYGHKLAAPGGPSNPAVSINKGTISSLRNDVRGDLSWVQINGDLNPGNSGGPIVNADGQLVGISTMVKLDERTGQMTRIGFAIPFDAVSKLIRKSRLPAPSEVPPAVTVSTQGATTQKGEKRIITLEQLNQIVTDLRSTDDAVRYAAAKSLANAKPLEEARVGVAILLEQLLKEDNPVARRGGAEALAVWATPRQIPALIKLIVDPELKVRGQAMKSLGLLAEPKAAEPIAARLVVDTDRKYASRALCALGSSAETAVGGYLSHDDAAVRTEACRILKVIGTEGSRGPLKKAAADGDQAVAAEATEALQAITARR